MKQPHAGFTLIEVLVALGVVAVTLGAGLRAASSFADNTERLVDVQAGHWCADNALTGLRLSKQFPGIGQTAFECQQLGRNYQGTVASQGTPNPNFRRIDVRVVDAHGQVVATLSTVLGRF